MSDLRKAKTIVIKVGTSSLMSSGGTSLDMEIVSSLVEDVVDLARHGKNVAIVTSGAVGLGMVKDGNKVVNRDVQVAARVGQPKLMHTYIELFEKKHGVQVGQLLLTSEEFFHYSTTLDKVVRPITDDFAAGVIPIINENDAITDKETTLGDNDALAAKIAHVIKADMLIMLSVKNGGMKGKGGSDAKEKAIAYAESFGIKVLLVDGKREHVIREILNGDRSGHNNVTELKAAARKDKERIKA